MKVPRIDRESIEDAQEITEKFLPCSTIRRRLLTFLSNAIIFSNGLRADNWNLNLDKNGGFIRLNVGHEYCIEIFKQHSSVLVMKDVLRDKLDGNRLSTQFKGHNGRNEVLTDNLETAPDCLVKVPGSVACHIAHERATDILPYLEEANRCFILYAINKTVQLPKMTRAHSTGFIGYLSKWSSNRIPNPTYAVSKDDFYDEQTREQKAAGRLSIYELRAKIKDNREIPVRVNVAISKLKRNPYVAEYAKRVANGICQDCKEPAPFVNRLTGGPFLETHHIIPLAQGGKDTIDNTTAVCPNCHRKRHYG